MVKNPPANAGDTGSIPGPGRSHMLQSYLFIHSFIHSFTHSFMAALGLCCCVWAFSSCDERGLLCAVRRLLIAVASLVAEHGL